MSIPSPWIGEAGNVPFPPIADILGPAHYVATMTSRGSLHEQVAANLLKMQSMAHFASDELWMTFYLSGPPDRLRTVAEELAGEGWQNTDGWEGAFLYPKARVARNLSAIVDVARSVQALC